MSVARNEIILLHEVAVVISSVAKHIAPLGSNAGLRELNGRIAGPPMPNAKRLCQGGLWYQGVFI